MKQWDFNIPQVRLPDKCPKAPKMLARSIAMCLFTGVVALPASSLAATVQGVAFLDKNNNGQMDAWEQSSVLANQVVSLWSSSNGFLTATTNAQGQYTFQNVNNGSYELRCDDLLWEGYVLTMPIQADFAPAEYEFDVSNNVETVNFGFRDLNAPPNTVPSITSEVATNLTLEVESTFNFDGAFTDPDDGETHVFSWSFQGTGLAVASYDTQAVTYRFNQVGTYDVFYNVTDSWGASVEQRYTVQVTNRLPTVTAQASAATIAVGNSVTFSGSISDTAGETHTVSWNFGDGSTSNTLNSNHTFMRAGTYNVTLTVTDNHGGVSVETIPITITNETPVVNAGADVETRIGEIVTFNGQVTDPDFGNSPTHVWLVDGTIIDIDQIVSMTPNSASTTASHTFNTKGTYVVTYRVTDSYGETGTDSLTVTVRGAIPVVNPITSTPNVAEDSTIAIDVGETVDFSATFTDLDNGTHTFEWQFGDNSSTTGSAQLGTAVTTSHTFMQSSPAEGFPVILTITDEEGNTAQQRVTVHVRGVNTDPCVASVPTIRSQNNGAWINPNTWTGNRLPTRNDWVLVEHNVMLIDNPTTAANEANARVRGLCIETDGIVRGNTGRYGSPTPMVELSVSILRNRGTIQTPSGVNASGPYGNVAAYNRATTGGNIKLTLGKFFTENGSQVISGSGGHDYLHKYFSFLNIWWGRVSIGAIGARGGKVEVEPFTFDTSGSMQSGRGGDAMVAATLSGWLWSSGNQSLIPGTRWTGYAGNGGIIDVRARNITESINQSTGQFLGGNGGNARDRIGSWSQARGGIGGAVRVDVGRQFGIIRVGRDGIVRWDPIILEAAETTIIEGGEHLVIFGGEGAQMDLTALVEGAITAGKTITIAVGKGGTVDLRGLSAEVFVAAEKLEIFADNILLDEGTTLESLTSAAEVTIAESKIIYDVSLSTRNFILGQPGEVATIDVTIKNGSPADDVYDLTVTDTTGWITQALPQSVKVNGQGQSILTFDITLPANRGNESIITVTATSQNDDTVQAVEEIRLGVAQEELVDPPRGNEQVDIVLAVEDSFNMEQHLIMVSNAVETLLAPLVEANDPAAERVNAFFDQFTADNPPTEAQINTFMTEIEQEFPNRDVLANFPTVELLTFKDDVVSRLVTKDLGAIVSRLRTIQPADSGDCANASVSAIETALANINDNGQVILATASPAHNLAINAIAQSQAKDVRVHVMLADTCSNDVEADKAFYKQIADSTNGQFNWVGSNINLEETTEGVLGVFEEAFPETNQNDDSGSGETGSGETGSGETGSGETGSGETGSGETGSGETGSGETGSGEVTGYTASGRLVDEQGQPIANAVLRANGQETTSDTNGDWFMSGFTEGEYTLEVTKDGYTFKPTNFITSHNVIHADVTVPAAESELKLTLVSDPAKVFEGEPLVTFVSVIENQGTQTATNVDFIYTLPVGVTFIDTETEGGTCSHDGNMTITCDLNDLPVTNSWVVNIHTAPTQANTLVSQAFVTSNEYPRNDETLNTPVYDYMTVTTWGSPRPATMEDTVTYYSRISSNPNNPTDVDAPVFTFTLPQGMKYSNATTQAGSCYIQGQQVTCNLDKLTKDTSVMVEVEAVPTASGRHIHAAELLANGATIARKGSIVVTPTPLFNSADLVMLIDDTVSMKNDIKVAIRALVKLVNELKESNDEAPVVALFTFKDDVTKRLITND
ncbi:MAG: PKD domain-containing protein, partial [Thiotrichaceae bacterium]|nr:PKD domain-containing protein [Thiotrichaceae bacterium]